jgi:hypothetical protein
MICQNILQKKWLRRRYKNEDNDKDGRRGVIRKICKRLQVEYLGMIDLNRRLRKH